MSTLTRAIVRISELCGAAAALAALGLIIVTMVEVLSRYLLHAPTVWAYDVAYMLNGAAFILACALGLHRNQHVSIDILSQFFSARLKRIIEVVAFTALVLPALGLICYSGWNQAWRSWITGEIEQVSPWQPKIWPFQTVLAVGLTALWLQVLGRVLRGPESDEAAH